MVAYIVCFDLSQPPIEQMAQIEYWMDFLSSALCIPLHTTKTTNWTLILAGLRADQQQSDWTIGPNTNNIISFCAKWPRLPIFPKWFVISSIKSRESVRLLLESVEMECDRIFQFHATEIPLSYRTLLLELQNCGDQRLFFPIQSLYQSYPCGMDESTFHQALKYLHAIGRVVLLKNDQVCIDPMSIPKIAAKFIAPENVRLSLLNFNAPILTLAEIGYLLEIDNQNNEKYLICFLFFSCFHN
jgi:hypothetical protein